MAFVLLPCDLPGTWPKIEKLLQPLQQEAAGHEEVAAALHALHSLCNISIDPGGLDSVPPGYFDAFKEFLAEDEGLRAVLQRALPQLVHSALQLAELKPPEGLSYSLQQQSDTLLLTRSMVASLVAHTFLSTLPRRSIMSHPTLWNPIMAPVLNQLHSEDERAKVRALLQYYALLAGWQDRMDGRILLDRKVMGADSFLRLRKWRESSRRLCRLQVTGEAVARIPSRPCLLACCCTAHPARAALVPHSLHDARALQDHPELLVTGLLVEKLEDNEALQVTGVVSPSPPWAPRPDDLTYALLDADDYSESWVLQYESVNLLRELNKSYLAFSPPITCTQEKDIPAIPAGVVLKRPLYSAASVISHSLSAEISLPSTPSGGGTAGEKTFQYPELVSAPAGGAIAKGSKRTSPRQSSKEVEKNEKPAEEQESERREEEKPVADREARGASETDKKKMPKILELFLPKKILAGNRKKSETSDARTEQTSGVGSMASGIGSMASVFGSMASGAGSSIASSSNKTSLLLKQEEDGRESGFHQDSEDVPSYVTAPTTLKKKKNKKNTAAGASDGDTKDNGAAGHDPAEGSTSDLLNRVLKAIQKLEAEQSILLKDVPASEIIQQDLIPNTDDLNTKSIARVKSKPPLPDSCKRPANSKRHPRPKGGSSDGCPGDLPPQQQQQLAGGRTRRKLSVYQSCSEDAHPPDDEQFFSASESLDSGEDAAQPRRRGGRRPRVSKCRRKSSFADRLREALERGGSSDRGSQASGRSGQPPQSLSRNNSGGFVLSSDEIAAGEDASVCGGQGPAGTGRKFTQRSDTVLELPGQQPGSPSEGGRWSVTSVGGSVPAEEEGEEEEEGDGSGSSRYSFSSDYTSDLDEVYDHLEEVLHQLEGATPGPRTAAIAQIAHSLLKRAFSESSKGLDMGLDAAVGDGSPGAAAAAAAAAGGSAGAGGEGRPRSMSMYEGSCQLDPDHRGADGAPSTRSVHGLSAVDHKALRDFEVPQTEGVTVLTESWGCDELAGDRQLKALIQWAAASLAGAEMVVYNTRGHESLVKLGVLSRVLGDRQWTVGHLTEGIVRHCRSTLALWRTHKSRQPDQDPRAEDLEGAESLFDRLLAPKEAKAKRDDA